MRLFKKKRTLDRHFHIIKIKSNDHKPCECSCHFVTHFVRNYPCMFRHKVSIKVHNKILLDNRARVAIACKFMPPCNYALKAMNVSCSLLERKRERKEIWIVACLTWRKILSSARPKRLSRLSANPWWNCLVCLTVRLNWNTLGLNEILNMEEMVFVSLETEFCGRRQKWTQWVQTYLL